MIVNRFCCSTASVLQHLGLGVHFPARIVIHLVDPRSQVESVTGSNFPAATHVCFPTPLGLQYTAYKAFASMAAEDVPDDLFKP